MHVMWDKAAANHLPLDSPNPHPPKVRQVPGHPDARVLQRLGARPRSRRRRAQHRGAGRRPVWWARGGRAGGRAKACGGQAPGTGTPAGALPHLVPWSQPACAPCSPAFYCQAAVAIGPAVILVHIVFGGLYVNVSRFVCPAPAGGAGGCPAQRARAPRAAGTCTRAGATCHASTADDCSPVSAPLTRFAPPVPRAGGQRAARAALPAQDVAHQERLPGGAAGSGTALC